MTTDDVRTVSRTRVLVSVLAVAGTVPYLVLKLLWLGGSRVGLLDPDFGTSTTMHVANGATFAMDAVAVLLAVAFVTRLGDRLPLPVLLAPAWVGSGLLAPVVVIVPLQLLVGVPASTSSSGPAPIADWVYAVVYAGFVWQGVFLLAATALFVHARWGAVASEPLRAPAPGPASAVAGVALAAAACVLVADGVVDAPVAWPNLGAELAALVACAAGLVVLHRGRAARAVPLVLLWTGSGAVVTWGVYDLLLATVPNDLTSGSGVLDVVVPAVGLGAGVATVVAVAVGTRPLRRDVRRPRVAA